MAKILSSVVGRAAAVPRPDAAAASRHRRAKKRRGVLRLEKVTSFAGLLAMKPIWDELLESCPHRTPFLTHEWITNWWKHFGEGKELCILVVREDSRPVLIAPLMKYVGPFHDRYLPIPTTIIETIANHHSNRADFIFKHFRHEYFRFVWDYLRTRERWHLLRFYPMPEETPTLSALRHWIDRDRIRAIFTRSQSSPYVSLSNIDALRSSVPKGILRLLRKAQREGREFHVEVTTDPAQLPAALADVFH